MCGHCVSLAQDKPVRSTLLTTGLHEGTEMAWTRFAAIDRNKLIVVPTLIEYADQLNRQVRLTRQTKAKPEKDCPSLNLVSGRS